MVTSRTIRWIILSVLIMSSFFLASFNATLKYIVDQRRELVQYNAVEKLNKKDEKMAWEEATLKANDALEKKRRNEAGEAPSASSSSISSISSSGSGSSSSSSGSSDINSDKVKEKDDDIHAHKGKRESHEAERSKRREREDPTIGKFRTTQRPLDGFAEEYYDETSLGGNHDGDGGHNGYGSESSGSVKFRDRPPVQSHSRQHARVHLSAPHPSGNSSTFTVADSHYAKAIRMLSSDFDSTNSGGNALPHPVSGGEYDQDIGGKNGRGDGFVKMDQKVRRRKRKTKKKKQKRASSTTSSRTEHGAAGKKGGNPFRMTSDSKWELPEDEPILNVILDVAYEWFVDTMDWLCETLGIELDYDEPLGSERFKSGSRSGDGGYEMAYEDDFFSWRDTRVGSQLIRIYGKVTGMWSRQKQVERQAATISAGSESSSSSSSQGETSLAERDRIAREGLFHLEKAAQLGHSEAQRMVANSLASGILPLSDHSLMHRIAEHQYSSSKNNKNWTSILSQSILEVPDDFSSGGQQLSRAILLWHLSAMDGNVESAMALGYRHLYSASGGSTQSSDLANAAVAGAGDNAGLNSGYHPVHGGPMTTHGTTPVSHYGVLGTCPTALAYYEAAAHGVMDELEAGPTKGKVNPPIEEHRLAEIYTHGGASVALDSHNKPDELEEALQYYRMLASRNRSPEPDLVAAFTIANFYFHGYRGVKQDLRLALKYYEICGDYNHWEGGGQAGLMHVWGIGMSPEERDLGVAYAYFKQGTPGGIEGCSERWRRRKNQNKDGVTEEVTMCDRHCVNGMGLLHLLGVEGLVDRNVNMARRWFEHGKDFGDPESIYNYAMLRLGWMVAELEDLPTKITDQSTATTSHEPRKAKTAFDQNYMALRADAPITGSTGEVRFNADASNYPGPSHSDHNVALQEFARAASKGHLQAKHKLGMLYASGAAIPKKHGQASKVIAQNCASALRYFKSVADAGHTVSRRNRAAWKQYGAGDYESALRNYLAAAETGNEIGQVNAAFLLEQGYCLGMTTSACTHASVRLWRAAARQGNLEACLRVGDFYYYGRMKMKNASGAPKPMSKEGSGGTGGETATVYDREEYLASLEAKAFYFIPGPYRWTRYILYPEELFDLTRKWLSRSVQNLHNYVSAKLSDAPSSGNDEPESVTSSSSDDATCDEGQGTCSAEWTGYSENEGDTNKEDDEHMAIAAQYYRKAAEEHKSSRANFNLGFMHEWGLGLTQDFPLAKRHYDLAGEDNSNMAASIALWAMDFHQKLVRFGMMLKDYARYYNLISDEVVLASEGDTPPGIPLEHESSLHDENPPPSYMEKKMKLWNAEEPIAVEDIINSMKFIPEHNIPGHFPDRFETEDFSGLPWTETHLWTIAKTHITAPFESRFSAYTSSSRVSDSERASLKLEINSFNGGRICFHLFAEVALPFQDFRLYRNTDALFQFDQGTSRYPHSWVDWCFELPAGKQVMEWALALPAYYDDNYKKEKVVAFIELSRHNQLSGDVLLDNVRFYPNVYDDFETGDFSLQKWRQYGDGAPWVISDINHEYATDGQYSAHAGPSTGISSGTSNLELVVDLGYTGALITFSLRVKTTAGESSLEDCVWFLVDRQPIRPWFGAVGEFHYTHHAKEGIHRLTWSYVSSGNDPEAGVWLDNISIYGPGRDIQLVPEARDLGWAGNDQGIDPPDLRG